MRRFRQLSSSTYVLATFIKAPGTPDYAGTPGAYTHMHICIHSAGRTITTLLVNLLKAADSGIATILNIQSHVVTKPVPSLSTFHDLTRPTTATSSGLEASPIRFRRCILYYFAAQSNGRKCANPKSPNLAKDPATTPFRLICNGAISLQPLCELVNARFHTDPHFPAKAASRHGPGSLCCNVYGRQSVLPDICYSKSQM